MGRVWAVAGIVCLMTAPVATAEEGPRVRGVGGYARWLIQMAGTYSLTVSQLTDELEKSDVVVYVRIAPMDDGTARTVLLNSAGPVRYLLTTIDINQGPDALVEMLGHELQHAVEIADARQVRDEAGLVALYRRIGLHRGATNRFETALAREMGRRARRDLVNRPAALYARHPQ